MGKERLNYVRKYFIQQKKVKMANFNINFFEYVKGQTFNEYVILFNLQISLKVINFKLVYKHQ